MEKFNTYSLTDGGNRRIDLHKNFRSRKEVLFDVNFIFRKIMHRNLGNVEYDDNAALYAGIEFPKLVTNVETDDLTAAKSPLSGSEILLFDADSVTETNAREAEARMIGGQIKAIVGRELAYDKESRHYRKAEYRDIVILLRSLSGWSEEFLAVLSDMGIPAYTGTRSGYFSALEVRTVLSFLRVLDNPRQDIPLAAVPTVDALAYNLYGCEQLICPMMDARRKQVYTGIYRFADHELITVSRQKAIAVEELIRELNALGEAVIFLGDGVTVYQEMLKENMQVPYSFAPAHLNKQRAGAVGALAEKYYREGKTVTAAEHQPEYLRVSQAERERAEREAGKK